MYPIKQNTGETIMFFAHDANGDGVIGLVDGGFTKRISKGSGAFAAMTVTITEAENGWYSLPLSAAHSDTTGLLSISVSHASIKRVNLQWRVSARMFDDNMATYTQPAGFLAATFPSGTVANTTNITAGTLTTVTTATNLTTNNDKTGYGLSNAAVQAIWDFLVSSATTLSSMGKLIKDNLDATISGRMATYTQPAGFLAANFPASVASPTNITAGTLTTVSGNVTGSVGSMAPAGIAANSLAAAAKQDIADYVLDRNMATGTDSGTDSTAVRTPRQGLRMLRNKTTITAGVATVTKEDDITASWTAAVTTAAGNPISGVDPT